MDAASLETLPLLSRALSFEDSLRRRTEGLTWGAWGLVLALVLLMYGAMGDVGETPPWWTYGLWVPWVLLGAGFTWALWRTASLRFGSKERAPAGAWVTVAWIAAIAASLSVFSLDARVPNPESLGVVAIGAAWLLAGATNLFRATASGRRAVIATGASLCAAGILLSFALPPPWGDDAARFGQGVARAALVAVVPMLAGLWQALRG